MIQYYQSDAELVKHRLPKWFYLKILQNGGTHKKLTTAGVLLLAWHEWLVVHLKHHLFAFYSLPSLLVEIWPLSSQW